jgi:hypothetical protein
MKYLKLFNEANGMFGSQDDYWSLYSETKQNIKLCLVDLMDAGMRCTPDAAGLYRIDLRIDPIDYQKGINFDDEVKESISWFLEVNQIAITKYNYTAKIDIRLSRKGKLDLNFDSSKLNIHLKKGDTIAFIEIRINLTKI